MAARILTTLHHISPDRLRERGQHDTAASLPWGDVDFVDPEAHGGPGLMRELLRRAGDYDAFILNLSGRREQLAAAMLRRLRPRLGLVLTDCTWKVESSMPARIASRAGIRLMDGPRTRYCVLSSAEEALFPRTWGVSPERVAYTPWYVWLSVQEEALSTNRGGFVFAGGDSMRDYGSLIEAARELPMEVRIASYSGPPQGSEPPPNVSFGSLPPEQYFKTMCEASVVVVALAADTERSAGQQSYLNPIAKGKLVVLNDTTGVRDYLRDRETALIVPSGDPAALAQAIGWALDPANADAVDRIADQGRREVRERFGLDRYVGQLVDLAGDVTRDL